MTRSRLRTSLAALAVVSALTAAGCGVEKEDAAGANANVNVKGPDKPTNFDGTGGVVFLKQAAEATAEIKTQKMSMVMEMTGVPMIGGMTIKMDGQIDVENDRAAVTMDMSDMMDMMGAFSTEDIPDDAGIIEMIVDGDTTYMKSSLFTMEDPSAKGWQKTDTDAMSDSDFSSGQSDPTAFLEFLKNSGTEVQEVGTDEVRGVKTTHVKTTLDTKKMLENADDASKDDMEKQLEDLGSLEGISEIPTEAWIDDDGLVRKIVMDFDLSQTADADDSGMEDASMTLTLEMYDFGEPVDIKIPSASEVSELDPSVLSSD